MLVGANTDVSQTLPDCLAETGIADLPIIIGAAVLLVLAGAVALYFSRRSAGSRTTPRHALLTLAVLPLLAGAIALGQTSTPAQAATDDTCTSSASDSAAATATETATPTPEPSSGSDDDSTEQPSATTDPEPSETPELEASETPEPSSTPEVIVVETVEPEFTVNPTCEVESTVTLPITTGVTYSSTRDGNLVTVTAEADSGYVLAAGSVTSWVFDVTGTTCPGGGAGGGGGGGGE